ncbi:MFS transporter [Pseudaminobacter soli (ex Li et al. 2025)]|uniref:MFS transporter n=1 Tax=Pseudaminobacter soli (ex Li et al. 2025) TaxID=1295366 RepID=A0A2P7RR80_9HYPH|nr:MFS transporter [Mesorhizobium soli]PSJ52722.1 MFS transporter [Mesorhizobium soli]
MTSVVDVTETRVWRDSRAVALLMAATLTVMANATISPALPGLQHLFADDPHAAMLTRLLVPAPSLSIALLAPLTGLAVDRFGRRFLLLTGILLFVVSGSAGLYLPDLPTIFMSRMILGVAVAFIMTAQTALIGDYFTGETRSALTGLQISARNFGGLVFILLAGSVAAISPRLAFGVYGLAVLVLPLTWMAIVEPRRTLPIRQAGHETGTGEPVRRRLLFMGLMAVQSLTNMIFFIMPTQLPFFLDARGYHSATLTGMTLSILMLAGGCLALLYTRIQRTIGYAGVFAFGYAAMAIGFLLLVLSPPLFLTFAGAASIGAGYAFVSPTFVTITLNLAPSHRRGVAGGILTASVFIGQFCSPLLSTPAVSGFGYDGLFFGAVVVLTIMAIAALSSTVMRSR